MRRRDRGTERDTETLRLAVKRQNTFIATIIDLDCSENLITMRTRDQYLRCIGRKKLRKLSYQFSEKKQVNDESSFVEASCFSMIFFNVLDEKNSLNLSMAE